MNPYLDNTFQGMRVILNPHLTEFKTITVPRSTKERWWSWPWRPWVTTKEQVAQVPSSRVLQIRDSFIMHPATYARLKTEQLTLLTQPEKS